MHSHRVRDITAAACKLADCPIEQVMESTRYNKKAEHARLHIAAYMRHHVGKAYPQAAKAVGNRRWSRRMITCAVKRFDALPTKEQLDMLDRMNDAIYHRHATLPAVAQPGVSDVPGARTPVRRRKAVQKRRSGTRQDAAHGRAAP